MEQNIDSTAINAMEECSRHSVEESITFPEMVRKLMDAGVEFYFADLCQHRKAYYMPDGAAHTVQDQGLESHPVAAEFSADEVRDAVRRIQRGEIKYREFLRQIMAAGTATYAVYITGKRAIYTGRRGDSYTEWFPGARG
jgi:uncharacterized protein YbcV (DUF1398 family)